MSRSEAAATEIREIALKLHAIDLKEQALLEERTELEKKLVALTVEVNP